MVLILAQMKDVGSKARCSYRRDTEVVVVRSRDDSCHRNEASSCSCSCMVVVVVEQASKMSLDRSQQWADDCHTLKEVDSMEEVLVGNACAAGADGAVVDALAAVGSLAFASTTDICNE